MSRTPEEGHTKACLARAMVSAVQNMLDQSKGGMHVHAYGCADTHKAEYRFHDIDTSTPYDFGSEREVVEFVYPPSDFDYDPETELASYADDIYFYPCAVTALAAVRNAGQRVKS